MGAKRIITPLVCFMVCLMLSWNASTWAKEYKVLILNGAADGMNNEAASLKKFEKVEGNTFTYDEIGINWQGNTHPVPGSIVLGEEIKVS